MHKGDQSCDEETNVLPGSRGGYQPGRAGPGCVHIPHVTTIGARGTRALTAIRLQFDV